MFDVPLLFSVPRSFHVPRPRQKREQSEERAQNILAFRHPRHRFHVQRMQGKQRRDKRAPPCRRVSRRSSRKSSTVLAR